MSPKIYVIHENDEWVAPLAAALEAIGAPFQSWHLARAHAAMHGIPPEGVFCNRTSASSHTRGNRSAPEYAVALIEWLEAHGRRLLNGSRAIDLEISKARQYVALDRHDIAIPPTRIAAGYAAVPAAADAVGFPLVVKPNRGGKGLGVQKFEGRAALDAALSAGRLDLGPDEVGVVQRYIVSADRSVLRCEFVGGKFLYAVRVDASNGFELCPAEACSIDEEPGAADGPGFTIVEGFAHPNIARFERFLAANDLEISGIEMIIDAHGTAWTYDVNTNTNYNPAAEEAAGLAGTEGSGVRALARRLTGELERLYPEALTAA